MEPADNHSPIAETAAAFGWVETNIESRFFSFSLYMDDLFYPRYA